MQVLHGALVQVLKTMSKAGFSASYIISPMDHAKPNELALRRCVESFKIFLLN